MVRFHRLCLRLVLQPWTRRWNKSSINRCNKPGEKRKHGALHCHVPAGKVEFVQWRHPNLLVHVVASNNRLNSVAAHLISDHTHTQLAARRMQPASNPQKFSLRNFIFHQSTKVFSLESFLLYATSPDLLLPLQSCLHNSTAHSGNLQTFPSLSQTPTLVTDLPCYTNTAQPKHLPVFH